MNTKVKNANIIRWVPLFLFFILAGGLWFLSEWQTGNTGVDQLISTGINSEINKTARLFDSPVEGISDSKHPFINFIIENQGAPVLWNFSETPPPVSNEFSYIENTNNGIIYINIFDEVDSSMNKEILNSLNLNVGVKLSTSTDAEGKITIGKQEIPIQYETADSWYHRWIIFIMFLCFICFVFLSTHTVSTFKDILIPITLLIIMRLTLFALKEIVEVEIFSLTNDKSLLFASVGDYIINIIFVLSILFLVRMVIKLHIKNSYFIRFLAFTNGVFISIFIYHFAVLIEGFILNAGYDVDIGSVILFDTASIVLVISMILHQLFIGFYSIYSLHAIKVAKPKFNALSYHLGGAILASLACYSMISFNAFFLGGFIVAYLVMMDLFLDSKRKSVIWLIWWMVIHSLLITSLVYYHGLKKDKISKKAALESTYKSFSEEDYYSIKSIKEVVLNEDTKNIISTLPYPSRLESKDIQSFLSKNVLESSSWDLNHVYLLDNNLRSLIKGSRFDSYTLNTELNTSMIIDDGIYYNYLSGNYLVLDTIYNEENPGSPFIIGTSFNNQPNQTPNNESIIIIKSGQIVYPEITYFDEITLNSLLTSSEDFSTDQFHFTVYPINQDVVISSYRSRTGLIKPMSLFSYLFTIGGIVIVILGFLNTRYDFILSPIHLKVDHKTSLRNRLQTGFIAMLIFSFIIIGLLTAIYFKNVIEGNETAISNDQWANIVNSVRNEAYLSQDGESAIVKIQNKLPELSGYYPHVLELFNDLGVLIYSSDPGSKTARMPWQVYSEIKVNRRIRSSLSQGRQKSYIPLFYEGNNPFAYLSIEDVGIKTGYQSIYDFIGTLLNVYVFLFLLAGAIGIFLSNSITMPLRNLADKLKEFKLGRQNEPLQWEGNDEIGTLINDYNNLIQQVQESADIIARTERDTAWREMAKQVAHEIKNPLTPMKLSLQYLQRAIQSEGVDPIPMIKRVTATLIEQIDNLSNIANEFSNFAKMPKSNNEKVVLNDLVEVVHDLFRKRDDMDITLSEPINDLYVFADRNQLVRILNNLVKNAIQAIPTERRGKINIALFQRDQHAVVEVKDNGIGIPDHMKKKVFTPNFTTKSSGTGLGLAISANIIEGFNGKIYFETEEGKGTSFYVEIPLMRQSKHDAGVQRVTLD